MSDANVYDQKWEKRFNLLLNMFNEREDGFITLSKDRNNLVHQELRDFVKQERKTLRLKVRKYKDCRKQKMDSIRFDWNQSSGYIVNTPIDEKQFLRDKILQLHREIEQKNNLIVQKDKIIKSQMKQLKEKDVEQQQTIERLKNEMENERHMFKHNYNDDVQCLFTLTKMKQKL